MKRYIGAAALAAALTSAACGSHGTDLTGPSNSIPNVAGNYSGTATLSLPELNQSMTCTTTTSVTQSGSTVSVAPLTLGSGGGCPAGYSIPIGQLTIDATGAFLGNANSTYSDPSCGVYAVVGSGGFFGRDLRATITMTSRTCWNINATFTLTRR